MRFLLSVPLLLAVIGCASSSITYREAPQPDKHSATIYIYRPGKFLLGAYDARLAVDGTSAAKLSGGGYTYLNMREGCHRIQLSWPYYATFGKEEVLDLCSRAGESYYVRIDGLNVVTWRFTLVGRAEALPEIDSAKYQPADTTSR